MDNFFLGCPAKMEDGRYMTDWRTANTREQFNKALVGVSNEDEYRVFLQQNGEKVLDKEWGLLKSSSCTSRVCFHSLPTNPAPGASNREFVTYNEVKTGKIDKSNPAYPKCQPMNDYRMYDTDGAKYW